MGRRKNLDVSTGFVALLMIVMLVLAGLILWLGIPALAEQQFGEAISYLTPFQKWNYSLQLVTNKSTLLDPVCTVPQEQEFVIEQGSSINQVVMNLEKDGLIPDSTSLRAYLIYKGLDTQILAGTYYLDCSKPAVEIADSIRNIYQEEVVFTILPGWRAEEIAAALPTSGIEVSPEDFLAVVHDPSGLTLPDYLTQGSSLEGFLYPGEYEVNRDISAGELAQMFLDRFMQTIPESLLAEVERNGISPYQAIIMASIVQRETFDEAERPLMASVFYNRLAAGMKLETDPTVQYALGYDASWGWWKSPLSVEDLGISSSYNTYLEYGLPPAPIANPELSSIEAVVEPTNTQFLYFRAKCDGSGTHVFAVTFEEHVQNACE